MARTIYQGKEAANYELFAFGKVMNSVGAKLKRKWIENGEPIMEWEADEGLKIRYTFQMLQREVKIEVDSSDPIKIGEFERKVLKAVKKTIK
ncbi:MAG: hypothetical protein AABW58_02800 [Nanoarchaeota archaeon]|mgnify:FL=1